MKTQHKRRNSGFTLVELLVVIAIIAVLAGAGFAAGNAAINKARKTTAQAAAVSIEQAVAAFYSEYGSFPTSTDPSATPINTATDSSFLNILLGTEGGTNPVNTRGIKFLTVKEGKANKNGLIYSGNSVQGLYDPWGNGYSVVLDHDYDERVVVDLPVGSDATLNGRKVAVFSPGVPSGTTVTTNSIIKTW